MSATTIKAAEKDRSVSRIQEKHRIGLRAMLILFVCDTTKLAPSQRWIKRPVLALDPTFAAVALAYATNEAHSASMPGSVARRGFDSLRFHATSASTQAASYSDRHTTDP